MDQLQSVIGNRKEALMKLDIAEQWTAALRSGDYTQTKSYLNKDNTFCCLGVLCDLAEKAGIVKKTSEGCDEGCCPVLYTAVDDDGDSSSYALPLAVREWSGINSLEGELTHKVDNYACLISINDSGNYTFDDIADIIENAVDEL